MTLAHLNDKSNQSRLLSELAHLNSQNSLEANLTTFLLAKKVDNRSPRTLVAYNEKVGRFIGYAGTHGIFRADEVSANLIRLWQSTLQETNNAVSVKGYFGHLKVFFNFLVDEGILTLSPMAKLHPPKVPNKIIMPFTEKQIGDILFMCDGDKWLGMRNRAIVLTFLDTGLRLSEMASIQIEDVDLEHETIKVMGKGAKERYVRIGKLAQRAIFQYVKGREFRSPALWIGRSGNPMRAQAIQTMIVRIGKLCGMKGVRCSPHTLRHTFAIYSLRNGMGEFALQALLGHSTLTMTQKYVSSFNSEDAIKIHRKTSPVDNLKL